MPLLEDDLVDLAGTIWESVLGLEASRVAPDTDLVGTQTMTACVHITGGWEGAVTLVLPVTLAERVAAGMFAMEPSELTDEYVSDAVGELVNIAGGNIKGMIEEPCSLSLPVVARGESYALRIPGAEMTGVAHLECCGDTFVFAVHSRSSSTPIA